MTTTELENGRGKIKDLDDYVQAFEECWQRNGRAQLGEFLPDRSDPLYLKVLNELVRVDLDYGWQLGCPQSLSNYQAQFPQLFDNPQYRGVIAFEEYRLRRRAGQEVSPKEYQQRFNVSTEDWPNRAETTNEDQHYLELGKTRQLPCAPEAADSSNGQELAEVSLAYQSFFKNGLEPTTSLEGWCPSSEAKPEHVELFRDLHKADPQAAERFSEAMINLPKVRGGTFLGFRLIAQLGQGGFARVFLAEQADLANRSVVLKIATDIFAESQTLAQLQHTHIMPNYSFHRAKPFQALCMPYLGPTTLADVLRIIKSQRSIPNSGKIFISTMHERQQSTRQPKSSTPIADSGSKDKVGDSDVEKEDEELRLRQVGTERYVNRTKEGRSQKSLVTLAGMGYVESVLWLAERLVDGLAHAHERGILHLDLKPANILLTDDGEPMLLDFNLSEDTKLRSSAAAASIGGTLPYMSPEHLDAFRNTNRALDARSDLYSFGVILFEMLTDRIPFPVYRRLPMKEVVTRMITDRRGNPPLLRSQDRSLSRGVESIVRHCLEPDPANRYQSARHLQEDLRRHLDNLPLKFVREGSLGERIRKWMRRHPKLSSVTTVAVVAATILLAMTTAFVIRGDQLRRLQARESLAAFEKEVAAAQILLYDRNADQRQLAEGVAKCQQALERYDVVGNSSWRDTNAVAALSGTDREKLSDGLSETLFLIAHASQILANASGDSASRDSHVQLALRCNMAAENVSPLDHGRRAIWEQRADLVRLAGTEDQARALLEKAGQFPLHGDRDYFLLGHKYALEGNFRKALPLLKEGTRENPRNFAAWFVRGNCHYELVQDADAVGCFNACIGLEPKFPWAWYNRGLAFVRQRNLNDALADFNRTIALRPDLAKAYLSRAQVALEMKEPNNAIADVDRAFELGAPTYAYFLRARARLAAGDKVGAHRDHQQGLQTEPSDEKSCVERGLALVSGNPQAALVAFDKALQLNPRSFEALQNKAALLCREFKNYDEGEKVLDQAVAWYPDSVLARAGRGVLLARRGKREAALRDATEALLLDTQPVTLYQVANIYALTSPQNPEDRLKALQLLAGALRNGFGLAWIDTDSDFDPVRMDPEFQRLVKASKELHGNPRP
jgi:serine/threonine protein kinase/Tfp pilus assembly protein PilF